MKKLCVYLHGFNSSPNARKPTLMRQKLQNTDIDFYAPDLIGEPLERLDYLKSELKEYRPDQLLILGSSLGGYYAAHLHDAIDAKIVLINPAMNPTASRNLLGEHTNLYSGRSFDVTEAHFEQLHDMKPALSKQDDILLMLQTGDELIDYRCAVSRLPDAKKIIQVGGSHTFDNFEWMIDDVLQFGFLVGNERLGI